MAVGAIVVAAVLAAAIALGLVRRHRDGQLRAQRGRVHHPGSGHPGSGHPGSGHPGSGHPDGRRPQRLTADQLGRRLGARATLLQFSSSFCSPCRAARQLLADVAAHNAGVAHIEIDVADRVDLVRLLNIRRTPTVLLLGPDGQVERRATGVPRRADLTAAVAPPGAAHTQWADRPGASHRGGGQPAATAQTADGE